MKIEIDNWNWFGISIYILRMFTGRALKEDKSLLSQGKGGGGLSYKSEGDACQKIQIKHLRETNVGVAQA